MRPSVVVLSLIALGLPAAAVAQCDPSTWFQADASDLECPANREEKIHLTVSLAETYIARAEDEDRAARHLEILKEKRGAISFEVEYLASDLDRETLVVPIDSVVVNRSRVEASLPFADLGKRKTIRSIHVVFPPESLFCNDSLVTEETSLEIPVLDENGAPVLDEEGAPAISCLVPDQGANDNDNEASRPWDWTVDLAPADDDAEDDPGVAVEFLVDREWGYGFDIDEKSQSWSSNLWRLKLEGAGTTNDADFHDSVTTDFSWARNRAYLGGDKRVTAYWLGAYLRPETTFGDEVRDYVYGARFEALANLKNLIGTNVGTGTRPYLSFGFEQVDPDKREDGTVPDNYERATADFLWKFSPFRRIRIEVDWEAKYILDEDDLTVLGLDNRLQDKLDFSVALDVSGQREFMPVLTYTRGAEAPRFEVVEEILFGLVWDRLFQGEAPQ